MWESHKVFNLVLQNALLSTEFMQSDFEPFTANGVRIALPPEQACWWFSLIRFMPVLQLALVDQYSIFKLQLPSKCQTLHWITEDLWMCMFLQKRNTKLVCVEVQCSRHCSVSWTWLSAGRWLPGQPHSVGIASAVLPGGKQWSWCGAPLNWALWWPLWQQSSLRKPPVTVSCFSFISSFNTIMAERAHHYYKKHSDMCNKLLGSAVTSGINVWMCKLSPFFPH